MKATPIPLFLLAALLAGCSATPRHEQQQSPEERFWTSPAKTTRVPNRPRAVKSTQYGGKSLKAPLLVNLDSIRIPSIEIADASIDELVFWVGVKISQNDPDPPSRRGFSIFCTIPGSVIDKKFDFKASNISAGQLLADLACLLNQDIHFTNVGIFIVKTGVPAFPNGKAASGLTLRTYHGGTTSGSLPRSGCESTFSRSRARTKNNKGTPG